MDHALSLQRIRSQTMSNGIFPSEFSPAKKLGDEFFACSYLGKGFPIPQKGWKFNPSAEIQISSIRNPPGKDSHGEFPATPMDVFTENHMAPEITNPP